MFLELFLHYVYSYLNFVIIFVEKRYKSEKYTLTHWSFPINGNLTCIYILLFSREFAAQQPKSSSPPKRLGKSGHF